MAQEWKTFSPENREATTGRNSAERPWVSMHPFGEVTRLETHIRPPDPSDVYLVMEIKIMSSSRVCLEIDTTQSASMIHTECECLACVL